MPFTLCADSYSEKPNGRNRKYPQDLYICNSCGHVQLLDILPESLLFDPNYSYSPRRNQKVVEHFGLYAEKIKIFSGLEPTSALDIGSNDGLFLECLRDRYQCEVLGVEPAKTPREIATEHGISSLDMFFNVATANEILKTHGTFDLVSANNVFAHNDDLDEITRGVSLLLNDNGVFCFEISYLVDIVERCLIGTLFHEHLSHHSLIPLTKYLKQFGLHIFHAETVDTQGGALVCMASKQERLGTAHLDKLIENESSIDVCSMNYIKKFSHGIQIKKERLWEELSSSGMQGGRIICVGASRSLNMFLELFQLTELVDVVLDSNPDKVGKYLYGTNVQIQDQSDFSFQDGDCVLITAWVHSKQIRKNLERLNTRLDIIDL